MNVPAKIIPRGDRGPCSIGPREIHTRTVWKTRKNPVITSAERVRIASTICRHAINQAIRSELAFVYVACVNVFCVSALMFLPFPVGWQSILCFVNR